MKAHIDRTLELSAKIVEVLRSNEVAMGEALRALDQAKEDLMRVRLEKHDGASKERVVALR